MFVDEEFELVRSGAPSWPAMAAQAHWPRCVLSTQLMAANFNSATDPRPCSHDACGRSRVEQVRIEMCMMDIRTNEADYNVNDHGNEAEI